MPLTAKTGKVSERKRPCFLWQGSLIVLPVLFLSVIGLFSLKQDAQLALQEARERADGLAEQGAQAMVQSLERLQPPVEEVLSGIFRSGNPSEVSSPTADALWVYSQSETSALVALLDTEGNLIYPPPRTETITPQPRDLALLDAEQNALWLTAQQLEWSDPGPAIDHYRQFLDANPPESFAASAFYSLNRLLQETGRVTDAKESLQQLVETHPAAIAESGLPYRLLAGWQMVVLALRAEPSENPSELSTPVSLETSRTNALHILGTEALRFPSEFSLHLLQRASSLERAIPPEGSAPVMGTWLALWQVHERARRLVSQPLVEFHCPSKSCKNFRNTLW